LYSYADRLNTRTGYLLPATKTVVTTFLKYFC
jgi:hypothetical protein